MTSRNAPEIDTSNTGQDESNDSENKPVAKKLRSSPTDLIIRIGKDKYEYHCHSMVMAHRSRFFDTALASPMHESQTRIIDLPDVSPKTWHFMMKILDLPPSFEVCKGANLDQIVLAAEKFDEYEFPTGNAVCAMHLTHIYEQARKKLDTAQPLETRAMGFLIKGALRCNQLQLKGCMLAILAFFRRALALPQETGNHKGGLIFKQEQLQELAPLIAENNLLGDGWTKEEILCPLFPKHFISTRLLEYEEKRFGPIYRRQSMARVRLQLTKSNGETCTIAILAPPDRPIPNPGYVGLPRNDESWSQDLRSSRIVLHQQKSRDRDKNWVILVPIRRQNNEDRRANRQATYRVLWRCPLSFNCTNFPPSKPWVRVDTNAPEGCLQVVRDRSDEAEFGFGAAIDFGRPAAEFIRLMREFEGPPDPRL